MFCRVLWSIWGVLFFSESFFNLNETFWWRSGDGQGRVFRSDCGCWLLKHFQVFFSWSEDREVVRVLVPAALTADRCEAREYSRCLRSQRGSLQHKRGVWVWVRFSRATSWSQLAAPALHTPLWGAEPPVG